MEDFEKTMGTNFKFEENLAVGSCVTDIIDQRSANIKTAKDGHTILIPQPSEDLSDPLNWSLIKNTSSWPLLVSRLFYLTMAVPPAP
jgi:hypothetical protein